MSDAPDVQTSDDTVELASFYPFPFNLNFDGENQDGEYTVRQTQVMPGQVIELTPEEWEQVKKLDAVQNGLDNQRLMKDPETNRLKRERNQLSSNFIDTSLIGELSQTARNSDLDQVAEEEVAEAERILRKAKREAQGSIGVHL